MPIRLILSIRCHILPGQENVQSFDLNSIRFRLVSHDFLLPGRQCHGSSKDAGRGQKKDGVTCPWPAPDSRCRAHIEEPCRLW